MSLSGQTARAAIFGAIVLCFARPTHAEGLLSAASLTLIGDFAAKMCATVNTRGEAESVEIKGEVKAQLKGLAARLADAGVAGSVKIADEKYDGVLRQDLASLLKDTTQCKLKIFDTLVGKLQTEVPATACLTLGRYPVGRWTVAVKSGPPAAYSRFIDFTGPAGGNWLPTTGTGSFEASNPLAAGVAVTLTFKTDIASPYRSVNKLVVSSDGCKMEGIFSDNEGHSGDVAYEYDAKPR